MKKLLMLALCLIGSVAAGDITPKLGIVDFELCATESKMGKEESTSFNSLQNKAMADMQSMEKERQELAKKTEDQDYLDGLSPDAQQELHQKVQNHQMKMQMAGESYEKTLRQTYEMMQDKLSTTVKQAAEKIAQEKKLDMVIPSRFCIYSMPTLNITDTVIKKMDEMFEKSQKENPEAKK